MNNDYMTVRVAAQQLNVTTRTITRWIKSGRISGAYQPVTGQTMPWLVPVSEVVRIEQERLTSKELK